MITSGGLPVILICGRSLGTHDIQTPSKAVRTTKLICSSVEATNFFYMYIQPGKAALITITPHTTSAVEGESTLYIHLVPMGSPCCMIIIRTFADFNFCKRDNLTPPGSRNGRATLNTPLPCNISILI